MNRGHLRALVSAGAVVAVALATVLIAQPASAHTATFVKTSTWETGFEGKFTITNNTSSTTTSWNVQFDLPSGTTMGTFWDALVTVSGQHVTAVNRDYNGTLAPNQQASFGFIGAGTGSPTNCTVNGASCSGGGPAVPGAPGNLRITGTTTSSISLAWNASTGTVSGYRVYEGSTVRATTTSLSATIGGLAAGSSHTYVVRAFNSAGESASSNSVTGTAQSGTGVPGVPGSFRVTGQTNSSISVAWNASTGTVSGYRVYEGSTVRATVTTGTSATIGSLAACTSHTYTVRAFNGSGESASSNSATGTTTGCPSSGAMAAAPYLYEGWGNPPAPSTVMSATGIRWFTMAFMLSGGGCTPAWDSTRPLTGGVDQQAINQIRAGGGDVIPSFGGWSGNKLGPNCSTASALAGAYQQVINAYSLKAIDIDIENIDEFENEAVQDRILNALKIVKQNNPAIKTIITFGTTTSGPNFWGTRLINQSAAIQANIDVFTIMPFDFGGGANMFTNTTTAAEGLKNALKSAYGWSDDTAYRHMGISGMNGLSDQQELTSPATWTQIRDWAAARHLARLSFWSVNRDRPCPGGGVVSDCSGISQTNWQFTSITAGYTP